LRLSIISLEQIIRKKLKRQPSDNSLTSKPAEELIPKKSKSETNTKERNRTPEKLKLNAEIEVTTNLKKSIDREVTKEIQLSLIEELNKKEDNRNAKLSLQAKARVAHFEEKDEKEKSEKTKAVRIERVFSLGSEKEKR